MSTEEEEPAADLSSDDERCAELTRAVKRAQMRIEEMTADQPADSRRVLSDGSEWEKEIDPTPWCEPDKCPASVCGGPHYEVQTDLGVEIVRADQSPVGAVPDSTKTENHAEAWSNPR